MCSNYSCASICRMPRIQRISYGMEILFCSRKKMFWPGHFVRDSKGYSILRYGIAGCGCTYDQYHIYTVTTSYIPALEQGPIRI